MRSTFRARKRFGQHFLCAPAFIDAIVAAIAPNATDHLVEIGPGLGALTQPLIPLCRQLDAIEIDRDLIQRQQHIEQMHSHVHFHQADALKFDLHQLAANELRVVGNLPYNITTPLLFHLFSQHTCICDMHFMLQKEVSDRLCATVGTSQYGRLSVMAQYHCQITPLFDLPPSAFKPPPRVTSTFIRLTWQTSQTANKAALAKVVQQAFSQRRKTLQNSLKSLLTADQIRACDIDPNARAQTLSVAEFILLSQQLS